MRKILVMAAALGIVAGCDNREPGDTTMALNANPPAATGTSGTSPAAAPAAASPSRETPAASAANTAPAFREVTIPAGTQGGQRLRLRGQGLNRRGGGRGDQYAKLKIVNPPRLTPNERELFERLRNESRFNARELMPNR